MKTNEFLSLGVNKSIVKLLSKSDITEPTSIQKEAIPLALEEKNIIGTAQTGTGKTLAFGIPIVQGLLDNPDDKAIIITPTRELAEQVLTNIKRVIPGELYNHTALLIGGERFGYQARKLSKPTRLVVGTPGRIIDHIQKETLSLTDTKYLVLDETDRMLDMGFSIQIDEILKYAINLKQRMLFSATLPPKVTNIIEKYIPNPHRISIGSTFNPADNLKQEIIKVDNEAEKFDILVEKINSYEGSIIIFVKTKAFTNKLVFDLKKHNIKSFAINGDLMHDKRKRIIKNFSNQRFRILVATDIASRGLDIPHIELVVNYELPQFPEDYIHRVGRTARANREGNAICFVSEKEKRSWMIIERLLYPDREHEKLPKKDNHKNKRNKRNKNFKSNRNNNQDNKNIKSDKPFEKKRNNRSDKFDNKKNNKSDFFDNKKNNKKSNNRPNRKFGESKDSSFKKRDNKGGFKNKR